MLLSDTEIVAHGDIIGIDKNLIVYGGYDSIIFELDYPFPLDDAPNLTKEQQIELSTSMIFRWEAFRSRAEKL